MKPEKPEIESRLEGFSTLPGDFEIQIQGRFESSHSLYEYFPDGSDEPLHGHSWLVQVVLSSKDGKCGPDGIVYDFLEARAGLDALIQRIDHRVINDLPEFHKVNPTTENVARWFARGLQGAVASSGGKIRRIVVHEGPDNQATFYPD